jgi:hypothetical protein
LGFREGGGFRGFSSTIVEELGCGGRWYGGVARAPPSVGDGQGRRGGVRGGMTGSRRGRRCDAEAKGKEEGRRRDKEPKRKKGRTFPLTHDGSRVRRF